MYEQAAVDMDMSRAVHRDYRFVAQVDFDWKEFVDAEEMIRYVWIAITGCPLKGIQDIHLGLLH